MGLRKPLILAILALFVLGGCGGSRLNPFNWFKSSSETTSVPAPGERPADKRLLVQQVTNMVIERMPGGVIVRATGLPPRQGFWDAELVPGEIVDGKITYDFRIFPPITGTAVSTTQSREIIVAAFLSDKKLKEISEITVQGATNGRTSRR